ncbi:MAG: type III pantothenate kinase [Gammaproteobacteria bacterium]
MILLIDAGNSRIKSARCASGEITLLDPVPTGSQTPPPEWRELEPPERVLVSSVAGADVAAAIGQWTTQLWSLDPEFARVRASAAGMTTRYDKPAQLGVDRWLAALAGYHLAAGAACVIDAGTALTLDIVDHGGVHLGGSIAPGLALMVDSLTRNTAHLQLDAFAVTDAVATNTAAAISSGCRDAFAGGIERMHAKIERELGADVAWFVTGGEAQIVMDACAMPLRPVPDLVLRGLAIAEGVAL